METQKRILIVDNDRFVLLVLREALVRMGQEFDVMTASTGHEALQKVADYRFDLVIVDMMMPDMHGSELTEIIKNLYYDTVFIWITAYGSHTVDRERRRLGVYRCLDKPLEISDLRQIVRRAIERGASVVVPA